MNALSDERRAEQRWLPDLGDPKKHYLTWGLTEPKACVQWHPPRPFKRAGVDEVFGYQLIAYYQPHWASWCGWHWRQAGNP